MENKRSKEYIKLLDEFFNSTSTKSIMIEELRRKQRIISSEQMFRLVNWDRENANLIKRKRIHLANCISSRAALQVLDDSYLEKMNTRISQINRFYDECSEKINISKEEYDKSLAELKKKLSNIKDQNAILTNDIKKLEEQEERYYRIKTQYEASLKIDSLKKEESKLKAELAQKGRPSFLTLKK